MNAECNEIDVKVATNLHHSHQIRFALDVMKAYGFWENCLVRIRVVFTGFGNAFVCKSCGL
jgi:hypothetical protein